MFLRCVVFVFSLVPSIDVCRAGGTSAPLLRAPYVVTALPSPLVISPQLTRQGSRRRWCIGRFPRSKGRGEMVGEGGKCLVLAGALGRDCLLFPSAFAFSLAATSLHNIISSPVVLNCAGLFPPHGFLPFIPEAGSSSRPFVLFRLLFFSPSLFSNLLSICSQFVLL